MSAPTVPFNPDGKGVRRAILISCPVCLLAKRYVILDPKMVIDNGPKIEENVNENNPEDMKSTKEKPEKLEAPFCIYSCAYKGCGYEEIHWYLLMRRS